MSRPSISSKVAWNKASPAQRAKIVSSNWANLRKKHGDASFIKSFNQQFGSSGKGAVAAFGKGSQAALKGPGDSGYPGYNSQKIKSYKKGGKVSKTGLAKLHKGERVLTTKQTKKFDSKKFENKKKKVFGL